MTGDSRFVTDFEVALGVDLGFGGEQAVSEDGNGDAAEDRDPGGWFIPHGCGPHHRERREKPYTDGDESGSVFSFSFGLKSR